MGHFSRYVGRKHRGDGEKSAVILVPSAALLVSLYLFTKPIGGRWTVVLTLPQQRLACLPEQTC